MFWDKKKPDLAEKDYLKIVQAIKNFIEDEFKKMNFEEVVIKQKVLTEQQNLMLRDFRDVVEKRIRELEERVSKLDGRTSYIG